MPLALYPAAQEIQDDAPVVLLYVPASQFEQSSVESWRLAALPLSLRYFPAGQEMQLLDPFLGATSPSGQMEQAVAPI